MSHHPSSQVYQDKEPSFNDLLNKLIQNDCMTIAECIPDQAIDIIITDPPYMMKNHWKCGNRLYSFKNHLNKIQDTFGHNFNPIAFLDLYKTKTKNGFVCWMSQTQIPLYLTWAQENGYKWELMVWCKSNGMPNGYNHLRSDMEYCMRFYRRGSYFNNNLTNDHYSRWYVAGTNSRLGHPCVKPLGLMERQVLLFSKPGDIVCDPFAGTATTLIAAHIHHRYFIGFENNSEFFNIGMKRLNEYTEQRTIFDVGNDS